MPAPNRKYANCRSPRCLPRPCAASTKRRRSVACSLSVSGRVRSLDGGVDALELLIGAGIAVRDDEHAAEGIHDVRVVVDAEVDRYIDAGLEPLLAVVEQRLTIAIGDVALQAVRLDHQCTDDLAGAHA